MKAQTQVPHKTKKVSTFPQLQISAHGEVSKKAFTSVEVH